MILKLYLDNCCFNRPYDDQSFIRNRLETEAKLYIQEKIIEGRYKFVWSYMLDFENDQNPFRDRQVEIVKWRELTKIIVLESESVLLRAEKLLQLKIKSKDAIHLSCAIESNCNYFLTTDDKLLNKDAFIEKIKIISPIGFIERMEENYD